MITKVGLAVFPGSNCEQDGVEAVETCLPEAQATRLWHKDRHPLDEFQLLILPGGFSYGDYLRCGAIAKVSPLMQDIVDFANRGGLVLGICNGFQLLCESGLLPGALIANQKQQFLCQRQCPLTVETTQSPFTQGYEEGQHIELPIAHGEGNYLADEATLAELERDGRIAFRYKADVNGSVGRIAGILNKEKNVLGMMPHPERNLRNAPQLGYSGAGAVLFQSLASLARPMEHA